MTESLSEADMEGVPSHIKMELENICKRMAHQVDSIHVFVNVHDPKKGNTHNFSTGCGNFYARIGQIKDWILSEDEMVKDDVRYKPY